RRAAPAGGRVPALEPGGCLYAGCAERGWLTVSLQTDQAGHTETGDTFGDMRRLLRIAVLAVMLAVPGAAFADTLSPGTGSLVVKDGSGTVSINARGGIIGRFDEGQITIDWSGG